VQFQNHFEMPWLNMLASKDDMESLIHI